MLVVMPKSCVIAGAFIVLFCALLDSSNGQELNAEPVVSLARQSRTLRLFRFLDNLVDRFVGTFLSSQPEPTLLSSGQSGGNRRDSSIGAVCRHSEECRSRNTNSVCYNGRCLCSLGHHYSKEKNECIRDIKCPSCSADSNADHCLGGLDIFCNGTCFGSSNGDNADTQERLSSLVVDLEKKQMATPNWPHNYPYGTDKFYCLTATTGKRVNLDFRWMDLETNCGMDDCDYVKVYDGCVADDRNNLLAFFNGDNSRAKECVTSVCNKMLVHFHSDPQKENKRADSRSGVMAYYKAVPYDTNPCSDVDNNMLP